MSILQRKEEIFGFAAVSFFFVVLCYLFYLFVLLFHAMEVKKANRLWGRRVGKIYIQQETSKNKVFGYPTCGKNDANKF